MKHHHRLAPLLGAFSLSCVLAACSQEVDSEQLGQASAKIVSLGPTNALCQDLLAGQTTDAGNVCVSVEGANLIVTFTTEGGWQMTEAHLWAGTSIAAMPQTKSGAPKIGNFPYNSGALAGSTTQSFSVPLSTFGLTGAETVCAPLTFYVAAHAALRRTNADGSVQTETGWAAGSRLVERGTWATYFSSQLTCKAETPPAPKNCETAFAYTTAAQSYCTNDIDGDGKPETRWGWFGNVAPGSYSYPLYAGAGKCDLSKGTLVGTVGVTYDGATATVVYRTASGYTMDATHVYLSATAQDTIAPGQFTSVKEGEDLTVATHTFTGFGGQNVFFSAHAEVCGF